MTSGSIHRPGGASADPRIFYVPQKPYTTIGTLREQVSLPCLAVGILVLSAFRAACGSKNACQQKLGILHIADACTSEIGKQRWACRQAEMRLYQPLRPHCCRGHCWTGKSTRVLIALC